jgi:hypothetical protein
MKKIIVCSGCLALIFLLSNLPAQGAAPMRFFLGPFVQTAPHYLNYGGYRFGGELGVQVSARLSFAIEAAGGSTTNTSTSESLYANTTETIKLTSSPMCFFVHFTAPVSEVFHPYVGVGVAYYALEIKHDYSYQDLMTPALSFSSSQTTKAHTTAPIFKLGMEVSLLKNVFVVGEYRHVVAKDTVAIEDPTGKVTSDIYFGGPEMKFGFRIVL